MPVVSGQEQVTTTKRGVYPKGKSGNPAGRPVGSGEAAQWRAALAQDADKIIAVVVAKALSGDLVACGLLLARVVPPLRPCDAAVAVKLGRGTVTMQARRLTKLMAAGAVPMQQGIDMVTALATIAKMRSLDELATTVDELQKQVEGIKNEVTRKKSR